jgi:sulfatase maturation enzyme AslB (radical SAM superfamily)
MTVQRISVEVTNRCQKGCSFCYNASGKERTTRWTSSSLIEFLQSCNREGTAAVSFGGGEPLLFEGLFEVLDGLMGTVFRSVTTNGLMLEQPENLHRLVAAQPDKVHISIHNPGDDQEVTRVIQQVSELQHRGITSGINLLVRRSSLPGAVRVGEKIRQAGIDSKRVIYIPLHGEDSPCPDDIAEVAGGQPFQSVNCLTGCRISPRFCSLGWDQSVGWCSYTSSRKMLKELTAEGLAAALKGLPLQECTELLPRK